MQSQIHLGDISVDVVLKDIKNVHLSVHPPAGRVRISAPRRMSLETIRVFALSKLEWILKQQAKLREQERETYRDYVDRESHFVWGKRCLLRVTEVDGPPSIELRHDRLLLQVRRGANAAKRREIVETWYRQQLKDAAAPFLILWEPRIGVEVGRFFVRRMKTKWGSCNTMARTIRLNTELAKKPPECLEYVLVHELVHLLEPTHNARFIELMDRFMPKWRLLRDELNRRPLAHEDWAY